MRSVGEILSQKGHSVWTVSPEATVLDALKVMADKQVGAVVVTSGEQVVGILSERDYARKIALLGRSSDTTPVRDIMTPNPVTVDPKRTTEECMAIMTEGRFRHAPVVDGTKLIGIISLGDLVKSVIDEQKFKISQLENYISS